MIRMEVHEQFSLVNNRYFRINSETAVKINSNGNHQHETSKDDKFSKGTISLKV